MKKSILLSIVFVFLLSGCEAKVGERCDSFFKNQCAYPGMCVSTDDAKVCAVGCASSMEIANLGQKYCKDPTYKMVDVTATMGSQSGAMGCYCIPQ